MFFGDIKRLIYCKTTDNVYEHQKWCQVLGYFNGKGLLMRAQCLVCGVRRPFFGEKEGGGIRAPRVVPVIYLKKSAPLFPLKCFF